MLNTEPITLTEAFELWFGQRVIEVPRARVALGVAAVDFNAWLAHRGVGSVPDAMLMHLLQTKFRLAAMFTVVMRNNDATGMVVFLRGHRLRTDEDGPGP